MKKLSLVAAICLGLGTMVSAQQKKSTAAVAPATATHKKEFKKAKMSREQQLERKKASHALKINTADPASRDTQPAN